MMRRRTSRFLTAIICAVLAGCSAAPPASAPLPPPPVHANGQVLWRIVHDLCLPDQLANARPDPCAEVSLASGVARGYAVLKDRAGNSQYLVMPTILITGIEDPRLLGADAADYFSPTWHARHLVEARLGRSLAREDVAIAINSRYGRSQDLLHLHVDCLRADVRDALRRDRVAIGPGWSRETIAGHDFSATRIAGDETVAQDPFRRLSEGLHVPPGEMGGWTLVLTGAHFNAGHPGFILLAARADPARGYFASGETLQDHACAGTGANNDGGSGLSAQGDKPQQR